MIDAVDLHSIKEKKLMKYMVNYLSMMMCICSIFLRMRKDDEANQKRNDIWGYLEQHDEKLYRHVRSSMLNIGTNLPTELGRRIGLHGYHIAQKIFKFN
jgi:hypothetical protein